MTDLTSAVGRLREGIEGKVHFCSLFAKDREDMALIISALEQARAALEEIRGSSQGHAPPAGDGRQKGPPSAGIEGIVRPIVEGQIRSFLHDHPEVLKGVTRHVFVGKGAAQWVTGSLAKRIVRDLTCAITGARLEAAFLAVRSEAQP